MNLLEIIPTDSTDFYVKTRNFSFAIDDSAHVRMG